MLDCALHWIYQISMMVSSVDTPRCISIMIDYDVGVGEKNDELMEKISRIPL